MSEPNNIKLSPAAEKVRAALDKEPVLTYEELRTLLKCDQRTVYDAIEQLRENGIPVQKDGWPKQVSLPQEHRRLPRQVVELNEEEVLALRLAAQVAHATFAPTPIAEHLTSAFHRLLAVVDEQAISIDHEDQKRQWHFGDAPSAPINKEHFDQLRRAVRARQPMMIDYYSASSERLWPKRRVQPFCITERSGTWLLVAWCYEREAVREFNLVDIVNVYEWEEEEELPLTLPEEAFDPELYFRDRFRHLGGDVVYEVRLLVEPHQARYFKRKLYHPTQQIEEEHDDGRIVVSYEVEGLDELRSFAQSWGTGVTVLEPDALRETLKSHAEILLARYTESNEHSTPDARQKTQRL